MLLGFLKKKCIWRGIGAGNGPPARHGPPAMRGGVGQTRKRVCSEVVLRIVVIRIVVIRSCATCYVVVLRAT